MSSHNSVAPPDNRSDYESNVIEISIVLLVNVRVPYQIIVID
jgi:hypothetical protein